MPGAILDWQWCSLDRLTTAQLYAVFSAREAVFVLEQHCAYQELDGLDLDAMHLIAWGSENHEVAAYLRVLAPGVKYAEPAIGRVLTSQKFRNTGLGRTLVSTGLDHVGKTYPGHAVRISAQAHLERFYRSLGFETASEPYLEDGIPHVEMLCNGHEIG